DIDAGLASDGLLIVHAYHDARGVHRVDDAAALGNDRHTGVDRDRTLHAGADQRSLGAQGRYRLALHVRAHEGAVGIVVLEEWDERCRHRHDLLRAHIHVVDAFPRHE